MTHVPPHGPPDAPIVYVGEAPGKDEGPAGIPFIGAAGQLLARMSYRASIKRNVSIGYQSQVGRTYQVDSEVLSLNVVDYFPQGDFYSLFYEKDKKTPKPVLLEQWDRLKHDLEGKPWSIAVAFGEHALRALTGKRGITKWQGSVLECTLIPGKKVIPIIHPAAILRGQFSQKPLAEHFLKRVKRESLYPEIRRPTYHFVIEPTIEQVEEAAQRLAGIPEIAPISLDIETKYNQLACIGFADSAEWAICIPFIASGFHYWADPIEERRAWQAVLTICQSPARKVLQNCLFDESHLAAHGIHLRNRWMDTMLAMNILYPELEKSLAIMTAIWTNQPYYKDMGRAVLGRKSEKVWAAAQADHDLWFYNCLDCVSTWKVSMEQVREFEESGRGRGWARP